MLLALAILFLTQKMDVHVGAHPISNVLQALKIDGLGICKHAPVIAMFKL
jgi:hypothetical protein